MMVINKYTEALLALQGIDLGTKECIFCYEQGDILMIVTQLPSTYPTPIVRIVCEKHVKSAQDLGWQLYDFD